LLLLSSEVHCVDSRDWSISSETPTPIRSAIHTILYSLIYKMNQSLDTVNHAIRLNDEAVLRMVEGKDHAAVTLLSKSLSIVFAVIRSDTRGPTPTPPTNEITSSPQPKETESPIDMSSSTSVPSPSYQMGRFFALQGTSAVRYAEGR
jgi:hypothetical protein